MILPKSFTERHHQVEYPKRVTFRDQIAVDIDRVFLSSPMDFNDLLDRLAGLGYEIKTGKHIAVKNINQKKFIRLDSLAEGFRENDLRARFEHTTGGTTPERRVSLLIDIQEKMREKGAGYARWATVFNLKQMAKTLLYLRDHSIESVNQLRELAEGRSEKESTLLENVKRLEKRLSDITEMRRHITDYIETKDVYAGYRKAGYSKKYLDVHREEILRHKQAKEAFDKYGSAIPKLHELNEEYKKVLAEKRSAYSEYRNEREKMKEILIVQENVKSFYRSISESPELSEKEKQR